MKKYLGIAAVAIMLFGCAPTSTEPSETDVKRVTDRANGVSAPPATTTVNGKITQGDWEVGNKANYEAGVITPGTYVLTVPENGFGCTWETVKNFSREGNYFHSIGFVQPNQVVNVVVKQHHFGLSLQGECLAVKKSALKKK